jgi:hypothetical protein
MKSISVNKALTLGWVLIGLIAFLFVVMLGAIAYLSDEYDWALYITIPAVVVLPVTGMIICFHYVGKTWPGWVYMRVTDVVEFEKAAQISGFGAYSIDDIKDKQRKHLVKERFANYYFEDDLSVPYQTTIYFRKPYQNSFFMIMFGAMIFALIPFFMFPAISVQLIIPAFFSIAAFVIYYNSSDRTPQIILSEAGIETKGTLYKWNEISDYEVIQGKISYLCYTHDGIKNEIKLDNLMIGRWRLNHILHVYYNRHKLKANT